ncbi:MAG: membrane or secreted protein [Spirosomataceae bacterium]
MKHWILTVALCFTLGQVGFSQMYTGTFERTDGGTTSRISVADGYFVWTDFSESKKEFIRTWGGKYTTSAQGQLAVNVEFDTREPEAVASMQTFSFKEKKKEWTVDGKSFQLLPGSQVGPMAGNWRISGRVGADGTLSEMRPGPRKTIKLLTGNTFQWAAINTETREFFGTGGGTYTFVNGKYTETIQFFSRDSSRVGNQLSFDANKEGKKWIHKGLSSKGDPIHEIWERK